MKSLVLSNFTELYLPLTALIIFLSVFIVMLLMVFNKKMSATYKEIELLPIKEGKENE